MNLLAQYQTLLELSRQMQESAEREDAAALLQLESQRAAIIAALPKVLPPQDARSAAQLRQLIEDIQRCDVEVLSYAQAHKALLGTLLGRFDRAA